MSSRGWRVGEESFSAVSSPFDASVLSEDDFDAACVVEPDRASSSTGEQHDFVPTGVIGSEFRALQEHHDIQKATIPRVSPERVFTKFENIDQLNKRETEQTFNIMCVGESGMGKSTLIESFFKTFREQDEVDRLVKEEESWRVQEKKQTLTREENKLREAEKEKKVLTDEEKLLEAEAKRLEVAAMQQVIEGIKAEIASLRAEDHACRTQLEELAKEIQTLKKQKEDAKKADRLREAHDLKEALAQKEKEKAELGRRLQRTAEGNEHSGDASRGAHNTKGEGARSLISEPTVEVVAKPAFDVRHRVGEQPPVVLKVTMIDTPGYGDNTNVETTFHKIVGYVDEQFSAHRQDEEKPNKRPQTRGKDPLVHCVFYFIAPHRLKPVDIAFMKELHMKAPIIPIIAKSDTMTSAEKKEFKERVRQVLQENQISIFEFEAKTIEEMSKQAEVAMGHPWAVIATKDAKIEDGEVKALRVYPWGDADAANPQHSDLLALQTLILGDASAWRQLKESSEQRYEMWREEVIAMERRKAAEPLQTRLLAKALAVYASVPPMYALSIFVLLIAIILTPAAIQVGMWVLQTHAAEQTQTLNLELQDKADEMAMLKRTIRAWHANSKAWYLEALPKVVLDD